MDKFKDFITEAVKVKVKRVKVIDLPAKTYGSNIPLCKGIHNDVDSVIDKIKAGYYVLENPKSYKNDIISPENLAKIEGATRDIIEGKTVKIGRSEYKIMWENYYSITSATAELEVTGEEMDKPKECPRKWDKMFDAQLVYGLNAGALSRNVADAHCTGGDTFGAYFNQGGDNVRVLGQEGTIKDNAPVIFWIQQHSSEKWAKFEKGELKYKEVHINRLFPGAYKKATYSKDRVLVLK